MSSRALIKSLQAFELYKNMNEYQIRKSIGQLYDISRARNIELEIELNELNKPINNDGLGEIHLNNDVLRADLKTVTQYCSTNKAAIKLCYDQYFWNEKLLLEGLPPILLNHDLNITTRPMPNLDNYNQYNKWMLMYELMKLAGEDAKKILLVNDIESTRQYKPTTGIIQTDQSDDIDINGFYVLPLKIIKKLKKSTKILRIEIHDHKLSLTTNLSQPILNASISSHEVLHIITLVLYDKYVDYNSDVLWQDSNEKEFYYDTDFRAGVDENGLLKQMIYETIITLEKKNILKL